MISDHEPSRVARGRQFEAAQILADILGKPRHAQRLGGVGFICAQQIAVVLDHGAATRGRDQDGVEALALDLGGPGVDLAAGGGEGLGLAAHMVGKGAAAALIRDHHLDAMAGQEADGGCVDRGGDHRADAAGQQCHPAAAGSGRRE